MATRGTLVLATALFSGLICANTATAQVSSADQRCIAAFNQGVRKVAKAQSKIVKKCLTDFASGRLSSATPEDCVRSDPKGRLDSAVVKAAARTTLLCTGSTPAFGTSAVETAYARASLSQIDLTHETVGRDLNTDLIPSSVGASCQAQVTGALLKCADRRVREYLKCQKDALRQGVATDAASLSDACLGTGAAAQPDPVGHIQADCDAKIGGAILQHCTGVDLGDAFGSCFAANPNDATDCLKRESACQLCLLMNDVDRLLARLRSHSTTATARTAAAAASAATASSSSGEACDDGNTVDGDGCSAHCTIEGGYTCTRPAERLHAATAATARSTRARSATTATSRTATAARAPATSRAGYECTGDAERLHARSAATARRCSRRRGLRRRQPRQRRRLLEHLPGRGRLQLQPATPSVCTFVCGNGTFQAGETCDDGNARQRRRLQPHLPDRAGLAVLRRRRACARRCAATA